MNLFKKEPTFDIVGKVGTFGAVSAFLVLGSVIAIATLGLNFGIDFAGGYEIQAKFPTKVTETEIKSALTPVLPEEPRVQRFGPESANEYLILIREQGTIPDQYRPCLEPICYRRRLTHLQIGNLIFTLCART